VVSARMIPGNEKPIYRMMNHLARRGTEIVYGTMNPPVHVSGHASLEELKLILSLVRPKYFMPVHGEYRQLAKHAQIGKGLPGAQVDEAFVLECGESLHIDRFGARKGATITVGRVCIDSGSVDEIVEDMVIRDRRHLSEDGFVLPIIAINKHTGKSETLPEIVSRGFVSLDDSADMLQGARQVVAKTLESSSAEERTDWGVMQEKIRTDLRRYINKQTSRRPLIMPVILEV
jgi:ribonuclease J